MAARRTILKGLTGGIAAAMLFAAAAPALAGEDVGRLNHITPPPSHALGDASPRLTIWTPPGYPVAQKRYGVVYMLDGQNLFDPKLAGYGKVWRADTTAAHMIADGRIPPVIIVGIWSDGPSRYRTYFPKTLHTAARGPMRAEMDRLAGGPMVSDKFLRYVATELKPWVDANYLTLPDRAHTTIIGSSAGALIALEAIATWPRVFGQAACVSMHWPLGDPSKVDADGKPIQTLWTNYFRRTLRKPGGRKIWFDRGTATLDASYEPYLEREAGELVKAGWTRDTDFRAETYYGAEHDENYWAARLPDMLQWLIGKPA